MRWLIMIDNQLQISIRATAPMDCCFTPLSIFISFIFNVHIFITLAPDIRMLRGPFCTFSKTGSMDSILDQWKYQRGILPNSWELELWISKQKINRILIGQDRGPIHSCIAYNFFLIILFAKFEMKPTTRKNQPPWEKPRAKGTQEVTPNWGLTFQVTTKLLQVAMRRWHAKSCQILWACLH